MRAATSPEMFFRAQRTLGPFVVLSMLGCAAASDDSATDQSLATNAAPLKRCSVDLGTLGGDGSEALGVRNGVVVGAADTGAVDPDGVPLWHAAVFHKGAHPVDLGTLGISSRAFAISDEGTIVGTSMVASGDTHSFVVRHHTMIDIGTLGGTWAVAEAIADDGTVVGTSTTKDGATHAFRYRDGTMVDLGTLGGDSSSAHAIYGNVIVGDSTTKSGETHAFRIHGDGAMIDLGAPAGLTSSTAASVNGHLIVGGGSGPGISHAVLWRGRHAVDLNPDDGASVAVGVNASGLVIGNAKVTIHSMTQHPFAWQDGTFFTIADGGNAVAVNDDGVVAGTQRTGRGSGHAFAWKNGRLVLLPNIGGTSSWANAIDAHGNIVGAALTAAGWAHATLWKHCD